MRLEQQQEQRTLWNKLGTVWGLVCDFVLLGLLWLLFSLPVVTLGAATAAALSYGIPRLEEKEGGLLATFWEHFRKHFKAATLLWLPMLAIAALIAVNAVFYYTAGGPLAVVGLGVCFAGTALLLAAQDFCFALVLWAPEGWAGTLKRALWLGLRHFPWVLLMLAADAALGAGALFLPVLWIVFPGLSMLVHCVCVRHVLKRYEETEDTEKSVDTEETEDIEDTEVSEETEDTEDT